MRIAIQDVKGQIEGMSWGVDPIEGVEATPELQKQIDAAKAWVRRPDPLSGRNLRQCLTSWLEEVLVTDALSLYPQRDRAGRPIGLMQIDGATIYPVVDSLGRPPLPPEAAFQQIVRGLPETEFQLGELWYRPRNTRPDCPYGRSATEMVIITVNLALRSQLRELAYFTDGTVPEGFYSIEDWDAEAIRNFQADFDAVLAGDDAARQSLRFVPKGTYQATKDRQWQYDAQEWLARVIAWAFGVSPLPIAKTINRTTSESMEMSSLESGVRPLAEFMAEVFTDYIQQVLGFTELQFAWGTDEVEDATVVYERTVAYFNRGGLSLNEFIEQTGGKPLDGEAGELHMLETASGPVFLEDLLEQREQARKQPKPATSGAAAAGRTIQVSGQVNDGEQDGSGDGAEEIDAELQRWRTFTLRRIKEGRPRRKFETEHLPRGVVTRVTVGLQRAGSDRNRIARVFERARKGSFLEEPPESLAKPTKKIEDLIASWLAEQSEAIIAAAVEDLEAAQASAAKLAKGTFDLNLPAEDLIDPLAKAIADAWRAGAAETVKVGGFEIDFDTAPEQALEYARARAAELVGKRILSDGSIIDSPTPGIAITEKLREEIQAKVVKGIEQGWSTQRLAEELQGGPLSFARATRIARTETGFAFNEGAAKVFEVAGQDLVDVLDGDGCLPGGHNDAAVASSQTPGQVEPDKLADGQVWTIAQMRAYLLGHPHCVRAFVAHEA